MTKFHNALNNVCCAKGFYEAIKCTAKIEGDKI